MDKTEELANLFYKELKKKFVGKLYKNEEIALFIRYLIIKHYGAIEARELLKTYEFKIKINPENMLHVNINRK